MNSAQRLGLPDGKLEPGLAGEVDHRLRPERAVQVGVQLGLGQAPDQLTREHRLLRPRRALTITRRIEPSARGASGASSMPRASVTYAAPAATLRLELRVVGPHAAAHVGAGVHLE